MSESWVNRLPDRVVEKMLDSVCERESDPRVRFISVGVTVDVSKKGTATISFSSEQDVFDLPEPAEVRKGEATTIVGLFNKITIE